MRPSRGKEYYMVANKLKELRHERRMTLDSLAQAIGTSKQTIHRYENGIIANIPPAKIELLARVLDITPGALMGWESENKKSIGNLPMLGEISCGTPRFVVEEQDGSYSSHTADADFCLRAHGDSMIGARIYDGDIVFIRSQESVNDGEIAAVIIDDEATLKRVYYYPNEGKLVLSPENPKYAPLIYEGKELESIKIIGKAVAFQSAIK